MVAIPTAIARATAQVLKRPHHLLVFLLVNLVTAGVLILPLQHVLSDELDPSLYGNEMARGVSWRAFDTILRTHPTLGSPDGLEMPDLSRLTGLPAQALAAGVVMFWLHALLHCGYLSTLGSGVAGRRSLLGGTGRFAVPGTALTALAAAGYGVVLWLGYGLGSRLLEPVLDSLDREWVALGIEWGRLALVLLGLLLVKLWFDLTKTSLVRRDTWNVLTATFDGSRELLGRPFTYVAAYALVGLASLILIPLWWWLPGRWAAYSTLGLVILFLLQQAFLAVRIAVRLVHLGTTRNLFVRER